VGNYIPQKNHKFIIDIFAQIAKSKPNSALLLVGRGEKMPEFENYARQKGLADKVHFLGSRTDANELYQAMDVFLFPSLHEGLPIAGVEAQAAGLCCFFSENVTQDIILNSNSTRLPLSFSAEKWAEIILEKSSNFNRCDVSDDIAKSGYSAEKTAKSMEEIYYGVQS
jgi:glycosyltransferase involved in cell wall biosynthesis